jgi:hypothetical protein
LVPLRIAPQLSGTYQRGGVIVVLPTVERRKAEPFNLCIAKIKPLYADAGTLKAAISQKQKPDMQEERRLISGMRSLPGFGGRSFQFDHANLRRARTSKCR